MLNKTTLVDIGPGKPGNVVEKRVSRSIVNENISLCSLDGEKNRPFGDAPEALHNEITNLVLEEVIGVKT